MLPDRQGGPLRLPSLPSPLPRAFEILFAHCVQPENIIEGRLQSHRSALGPASLRPRRWGHRSRRGWGYSGTGGLRKAKMDLR